MSSSKFDASQRKVSLLQIKGSTFRNGQLVENDHIFLIIDRRITPILSKNLLNATNQPHIRLSVDRKMNTFFRNLLVFLTIWLLSIIFHRAYEINNSLQWGTNDKHVQQLDNRDLNKKCSCNTVFQEGSGSVGTLSWIKCNRMLRKTKTYEEPKLTDQKPLSGH